MFPVLLIIYTSIIFMAAMGVVDYLKNTAVGYGLERIGITQAAMACILTSSWICGLKWNVRRSLKKRTQGNNLCLFLGGLTCERTRPIY